MTKNDQPPVRWENILSKARIIFPLIMGGDKAPFHQTVPTLIVGYRKMLKGSTAPINLLCLPHDIDHARAFVLASRQLSMPCAVLLEIDDEWKISSGTHALCALSTLQSLGLNAFVIRSNKLPIKELSEKLTPYSQIPIFYEEKNRYTLIPKIKDTDELGDSLLVATQRLPVFLPPEADFSPAILCSEDMSEAIMEAERQSYDILFIELFDPEDTSFLLHNLYMFSLPISVITHDPEALEEVAVNYGGRLLIDRNCDIETSIIEHICKKYGSILI
jgi:hypothetical protein